MHEDHQEGSSTGLDPNSCCLQLALPTHNQEGLQRTQTLDTLQDIPKTSTNARTIFHGAALRA